MEPDPRRTYQEKLRDPRWQKKRLEIFQRDEWCCQICFESGQTLHVHHRYDDRRPEPWDDPLEALMTVCATCHEEETKARPVVEQVLLRTLRAAGLVHHEVRELAWGFRYWEQVQLTEVNTSVLAWALSQPDVMDEIHERYVAWLKEHRPSLEPRGHQREHEKEQLIAQYRQGRAP